MEPLYPAWAARDKWASQDPRVRQWTTTKWVHLQEAYLPVICLVDLVDHQEVQAAQEWVVQVAQEGTQVALVAYPGVSRILQSCMVVEPI